MENIQLFSQGSPGAVFKLNQIIEQLRRLERLTGDGFIEVMATGWGTTIKLNVDRLRGLFPSGGGGGTAAESINWAVVIERPEYEELPDNPGRAYYTLRQVGVEYQNWTAKDYAVNDIVSWNGPSYKCKVAHEANPDITPDNTAYWEKLEEIRIEEALGWENMVVDLRDFINWYEPGEIVKYVTRTVNDTPRHFLDMPLIYTGPAEESTLRQFTDTGDTITYARAVFR